jgi:hypothetical protein
MDAIGPRLVACSEMYNDAEHAASMRVTVCAERALGYANWTTGRALRHWKTELHPGRPATAIQTGGTWEAPGGFHQVSPREMAALGGAHLVFVDDGFFDFNFFVMKSVPVPLSYRRVWDMRFGFSIDNFGTHSQRLLCVTGLLTDDGGASFYQHFEGNVTVRVRCDATMEDERVRVDEVVPGPVVTAYLALKCPTKQRLEFTQRGSMSWQNAA